MVLTDNGIKIICLWRWGVHHGPCSLPLYLQIQVTQRQYIPFGARMGWTYTLDFVPISFDFVENYQMYFRQIERNDYPRVNQSYDFQALPYPAIQSVAVEIDTSKLVMYTISPVSCRSGQLFRILVGDNTIQLKPVFGDWLSSAWSFSSILISLGNIWMEFAENIQ